MHEFSRIQRLPPYVFNLIDDVKAEMQKDGEKIIDFGMGNPDQPAPPHVIEALKQAADDPNASRYSVSRGIKPLRKAICQWYGERFDVDLDPEREAIVTMGSKEGLAHLFLATMGPGDAALVPNPSYPIHTFGFVMAGADIRHVPMISENSFLKELQDVIKLSWPKPKMLVLSFPSNPTTQCVTLNFFEKIIDIAKEHGIWVVHDLAYADICFDGYKAPSILQVKGAKEIAVEAYTLSKSYNMAGWRVGFMCGNSTLIAALKRIKSYLDYGLFSPIQHAAIAALTGPQECVRDIRNLYRDRRNYLCDALGEIGWHIKKPRATMFLWAEIPEPYRHLGSLPFTKQLLENARVAVAPGIGFGEYGNDFVRISLVQDEETMKQAVQQIGEAFNFKEGA